MALKTAFRYFADELLPYFGIRKKAAAVAPTELVHLEVKTFVFRMIWLWHDLEPPVRKAGGFTITARKAEIPSDKQKSP